MPEATVTSKGQLTLPLEVRESLGLTAGSRVSFVRLPDGAYELLPATGSVRALRGMLSGSRDAVPLERMDSAVVEGAVERSAR